MKTFTTILLLLSCYFVNSQNIIKWCYQNDNVFNGISNTHSFLEGSLLTDSVIESEYYFLNMAGEPYLSANVRADSIGKVYITFLSMGAGAPEILLYDFSLEEGDTMHYYYGGLPDYIIDQYHYKVVLDTDSIMIDGQQRKTIILESYGGTSFYETGTHFWIEGYGSMISRGFTNPLQTDMITNGDSYSFNCVQENDIEIYSSNLCYCNFVDNIDNLIEKSPQIEIENSKILIQYDDNYTIELIDITGKLFLKKELFGYAQLDIQIFPKGLYFLRVMGDNYCISNKLIVE